MLRLAEEFASAALSGLVPREGGGAAVQQENRETAELQALAAEQTGDEYDRLIAKSALHASKEDWHKAALAEREAIAVKPDDPVAYYNLGATLSSSGHIVEAAQRFLEAKERYAEGSEDWAKSTAHAFNLLQLAVCVEGGGGGASSAAVGGARARGRQGACGVELMVRACGRAAADGARRDEHASTRAASGRADLGRVR